MAASTRDEPVLERIMDAAFRLPYWTTDEALLGLDPSIARACGLVIALRDEAVQEAAERVVAELAPSAKHNG